MKLKDLAYLYFELKYFEQWEASKSVKGYLDEIRDVINEDFTKELAKKNITLDEFNYMEDMACAAFYDYPLFSIRDEEKTELFESLISKSIIVPLTKKQIKTVDDDYEYTQSCKISYYKPHKSYTRLLNPMLRG